MIILETAGKFIDAALLLLLVRIGRLIHLMNGTI